MWRLISTLVLKLNDFARSQTVTCTVKVVIEMVQDRDDVTTDH